MSAPAARPSLPTSPPAARSAERSKDEAIASRMGIEVVVVPVA